MAILGSTRAVGLKLVEDVKKILFWTTIIVSLIFFGFYGYSIYINVDNFIFLITYSLLFSIAVITFVNYLLTYSKTTTRIKRFKRFLRVLKYIVNGTMLVVNVINMIIYPVSDLSKILLIVSAISLLVQVIVELLRIFIENYVNMFMIAVQDDFSIVFKASELGGVKGAALKIIDAPIEAIAKKITKEKEPELTKTELKVKKLEEEFEERLIEQKREKEIKKQTIVNNEKNEIKAHLKVIKDKILRKK